LTRVPSGATRARRALQITPVAPTGAAFPLKTGALFLIGITHSFSRTTGPPFPLKSTISVASASQPRKKLFLFFLGQTRMLKAPIFSVRAERITKVENVFCHRKNWY
jgi:hypothetical protein